MLPWIALLLLATAQARSVENGRSFRRQLYPTDYELRLTGGSELYGKVEIAYGGRWYSVCDDDFDNFDAAVACRQLRKAGGQKISNSLQYGRGIAEVFLDDLHCSGNEARLIDCPHTNQQYHDCLGEIESAVISCDPVTYYQDPYYPYRPQAAVPPSAVVSLDIQSARLTSGPHGGEGLLEVQIDGVFKYVCTNNWDDMDAKVACRMMGMQQGQAIAPYPYNTYLNFWQIDEMWMDDFQCSGTENALDQCPNMGYDRYTSNCIDKTMLAAVRCNAGAAAPAPTTLVKLEGGRSLYEGQVKCLHGNDYYPICADSFGASEAQVVCNQLFGYRGMVGTPVFPRSGESNAYYMQGFYDVQCQGTETSLTQCFSNFINNRQRTCARGDATVICS